MSEVSDRRRKDDVAIKKLFVAFLFSIGLQAIGAIYFFGYFVHKVQTNSAVLEKHDARIFKLEANNERFARIEVLVEEMNKKVDYVLKYQRNMKKEMSYVQ